MKNKFTSLLCITALSFSLQANADDRSFTANSPLDVTAIGSVTETITINLSGTSTTSGVTEHHVNIHDLVLGSVTSVNNTGNISTSGNNASVIFAHNTQPYLLLTNNYGTLTSSGNKATIHRGGSSFIGDRTVIENHGSITNTNSGNSIDEATVDISGGSANIINYIGADIRAAGNKGAINITNESDKTNAISNYGIITNDNTAMSEGLININGGNATIINGSNVSYPSSMTVAGTKAVINIVNNANGITNIENNEGGLISSSNSGTTDEAVINISGGSAAITNKANATISGAGTKGSINITNDADKTTTITNAGTVTNTNSTSSEGLIKINGGNATITNSGSMTAAGTKAVIDVTNTKVAGVTKITNSGDISTSNAGITQAVININGGSAEITNTGSISAAENSDLAIYLTGGIADNLTLVTNTHITGKISAGGSSNILKVSDINVTAAAYNALVRQLDSSRGTWRTEIVGGSISSGGGSEIIPDLVLNGNATFLNTGNMTSLKLEHSGASATNQSTGNISEVDVTDGSMTNNGTINTANISGGTTNNTKVINTANISGGTTNNTKTINTANISGGTTNNSDTITFANISGGTTNNSGTLIHTILSSGILNNTGRITHNALMMTGGTLTNSSGGNISTLDMSHGTAINAYTTGAASTGTITTANLSNDSTMTNNSGGSITSLSLTDSSTVNNAGNITTANLASSGTSSNSGNFTTLSMSNGVLNNTSGSSITNLTLSGGNFNVAIGSTVGTTNAANSTVSVTGGTATNNGGTFRALSLNSGTLANDSGTVDKMLFTSGTITSGGTISNLQFDTTGAYGNIASTGVGLINMNVDSANVNYGNVLSDSGILIKSGTSRLSITGNSNIHNGNFNVTAGELKVNGTTASQVIVQNGALLTGSGTIGSLNLQSGATLASGNSIGTMNVVGNITLNSGSTDLIEYNNVAMDKTQTTNGNISVAGNAIFSLFNYPDGNFVVSQNILETTNGIRTGTFDSTSTTNSNYIVSTDYTAKAVRATVSRKLNASTLDAPLAIQNSIGRLMNKSLADQLQAYSDSNKEKAAMWVSYDSFNGTRGSLENSTNYSFNGDLKSAGAVKKVGAFDVIGSVFNSQSNANRFDYFGKDQIETNGGSVGIGAGCTGESGNSVYTSLQFGFGAYTSNNKRNVGVNGVNENATSKSKGNFKQITLGTSFNVPTSETGKFTFSVLVGVQETKNNGFNENGLSYGNLNVSESRAKNFNYEIGLGYQNEFAKMFMLPSKSSYRVELTGYQSNLYAKDNATATQGNSSYLIAARYNQNFTFGTNISATLPITEATSFSGKFTRRENGNFKESIVGAELKHQF